MSARHSTLARMLPAIALLGLLIAPLSLGSFQISQLTLFLSFAALALALDLAWGQAGILSLGHGAFFGIGAYAMALITTRLDLAGGVYLALVAAAAAAAAGAWLLGWFAFRGGVSGPFLGILTLAVSLLLEQVALQWTSLTGGFNGIYGVPPLTLDPHGAYFIALACLVLAYLVARFVAAGPFGLVLAALRDNETRAQFSGYDPIRYRIVVFTISGGLAGLAGALYAQQAGFVSPTLLGFDLSVQVAIWVVLGGLGTLVGPALGAVAVSSIRDAVSESALEYYPLILGLTFIVVVLLVPQGLYGSLARLAERVPLRRGASKQGAALTEADPVEAVPGDRPGTDAPPALEARALEKRFGALTVLDGVDLVVRDGELRCIIGPNGAGKTTLLNVITGAIPGGADGRVLVFGKDSTGIRPHRLVARGMGRKFQTPSVFPALTVRENLLVAAWGRGNRWLALLARRVRPQVGREALTLLRSSGLDARLELPAAELSHGEQQTLELAMVLAGRPRLLLLDEPTAGLTPHETETAARTLTELASERGLTVVVIEHDMGFVRSFSHRVTVLHRGGVLADGTLEEAQANSDVRSVYLGGAV